MQPDKGIFSGCQAAPTVSSRYRPNRQIRTLPLCLPTSPFGYNHAPGMLSCPERTNHLAHGAAHQCEFVKPNGVRCRANARTAAAHCWFHDPKLARERLRARKRGGIARSHRAATLPPDAPQRSLGTVADVLGLLEEAANEVRTGGLEPKLANCVGYLCSVALNGLAQVPSSKSSVVQFLVVPPSGILECPSCQKGRNADGSECIACAGTGTLDLSEVPKSEVELRMGNASDRRS